MLIRKLSERDFEASQALVLKTIREINCKDYSPAQCAAWSGRISDPKSWKERSSGKEGVAAFLKDELVGFADLTLSGHLDMFFVHADHQGKGIAKALMEEIKKLAEKHQHKTLTSDVSLTAKPFFEKSGFQIIARQQVPIGAEILENFHMACPVSRQATN